MRSIRTPGTRRAHTPTAAFAALSHASAPMRVSTNTHRDVRARATRARTVAEPDEPGGTHAEVRRHERKVEELRGDEDGVAGEERGDERLCAGGRVSSV
jgi:hypothetical protein